MFEDDELDLFELLLELDDGGGELEELFELFEEEELLLVGMMK